MNLNVINKINLKVQELESKEDYNKLKSKRLRRLCEVLNFLYEVADNCELNNLYNKWSIYYWISELYPNS